MAVNAVRSVNEAMQVYENLFGEVKKEVRITRSDIETIRKASPGDIKMNNLMLSKADKERRDYEKREGVRFSDEMRWIVLGAA